VALTAMVEKIEVRLASDDEAYYLEVPPGAALLSITRTASDASGDPVEHSRDLFRGDRTRLVVRSGAAAATGPGPIPGHAEVVQLRGSLSDDMGKVTSKDQTAGRQA
jgi:GntR family transcriptional regulator